MRTILSIFALSTLFIHPIAMADDSSSPWTNEIELGFLINRGNTHSSHFDSKFTNKYEHQRTHNTFMVSAFLDTGRDNDRGSYKTGQKISINDNLQLKFTPKVYSYIELDGQEDKFSGYDYVVQFSFGAGYRIYDNEKIKWWVESGPGGRFSRATNINNERLRYQEWILHNNTKLSWKLSEFSEFSQELSLDVGPENRKTKSTSAIKAKILKDFSIKLSYILENNSYLPDTGREQFHTDTTTTLTAVYIF